MIVITVLETAVGSGLNSLKRGLRMAINQLTDSQRIPGVQDSTESIPEVSSEETMNTARNHSRPITVRKLSQVL